MNAKRARNLSIKTEVSGDANEVKDRLLNLRDEAKKKGPVKEEAEAISPGKAKLESSKSRGGRN
ncbi:MAG: hypothetical protein KKD46_03365 [Euryarchaeota archaeon]|nr:hypothetical protein [Euryarchaeota archaeon]MBU4339939.1 hypothetical protein [Euryarchaeota archaeon]MBU4453681.1 hypothetical protein [Euryarchaeota archaeon]